ncbi:MAG: hypothetical protein ACOYVK_14635 [Bacillota bacterium]
MSGKNNPKPTSNQQTIIRKDESAGSMDNSNLAVLRPSNTTSQNTQNNS